MMESTRAIINGYKRFMSERMTLLDSDLKTGVELVILKAEAELKQAEADREKQTAKKVMTVSEANVNRVSFVCPSCNLKIFVDNYCSHCGQRLEW